MSRPVGHYYNADTTTSTTTTMNTSTIPDAMTTPSSTGGSTIGPTGGYYGTTTPAAVDPADQWDWTTPTTEESSTSDWYDNTTKAGTTETVASSAPAPAAAKKTPTTTSTLYTSTGFYNPSTTTATTNQNKNTNITNSSDQDPFLSGSMDDSPYYAGSTTTNKPSILQPQTFVPRPVTNSSSTGSFAALNASEVDEAPLLEELGINLEHIYLKTKAVVLPFGRFGGTQMQPADIVQDADLAGPIAFALILGAEMVLTGRFQFGYIYGFGVFGCISMTLIVNLMTSVSKGISIWTVSSVLGYALIPVNILAALKVIVINLINLQTLGRFLGIITVAWSTIASTRLLELGCGLREQRYLIAYPIGLLYSAFVMITIF